MANGEVFQGSIAAKSPSIWDSALEGDGEFGSIAAAVRLSTGAIAIADWARGQFACFRRQGGFSGS
jgi:hypothetical protein